MSEKRYFELYLSDDEVTSNDWHEFYSSIVSHLRFLAKFEIIFCSTNNCIRFFIICDHELDILSNSINKFTLCPTNKSNIKLPKYFKNERLGGFLDSGNILDLNEHLHLVRSKKLEYACFKIRIVTKDNAISKYRFYLKDNKNEYSTISGIATSFPSELLAINFAKNTRYFKKESPKYLNIEKSLHMMVRENRDAIFEVDTFPYLSQKYFLNLTNYDFDRHSLIIGGSGSGKSKLISLFVDRLNSISLNINYRVIVIDPHASLADDFSHISKKKIITFGKDNGTDLFPDANSDIFSATELTATLFKSVLNEQYNPKLDKLLRFCLFTLMTAQIMSLENLKRFLTDIEYRIKIVEHVENYIPQNIVKFFSTGFNEMQTRNYDDTILPLISMVDEMQLQPSLINENDTSLTKLIQENFLTVFSINKISMGEKVTKTVAGLLIQQIFLLAQSRIFGQKLILIIDEVSIVQNPALTQILAEARKFNLTVILTQQYLGQVNNDLKQAIFANVLNYYVFKVSEDDAKSIVGNLNIEIPKQIAKNNSESDLKIKILTQLQPRECIVQVISNGQIASCVKAKTMDAPEVNKLFDKVTNPKNKKLPNKFIEKSQNNNKEELPEHISSEKINPPTSSSIYNLLTMNSQSNKEDDK